VIDLSLNRFAVIGRAGMDFYPEPPGTKIEDATKFSTGLGGSSANICVAIAKQGGQASLITCVSDDAIGRFCINQLQGYGIDTTYVRSVGGEARNSLAVSESTVEDHQTVIYRNGAADFEMTVDDVTSLDYASYSALITTGTVLAAEPSRSAAFHAFDLAKKAGGFMAGNYDDGLQKARALAQSTAAIVIYKMGEKGAITLAGDSEITTGIYPVDALKVPVTALWAVLSGHWQMGMISKLRCSVVRPVRL